MILLLAHGIGDFLLQTNWMAAHKKSRALPLLTHVMLYTFSIWVFTRWGIWDLLLVAVYHAAVDGSDVVARFNRWKNKSSLAWLDIVADQIIHLSVLYIIDIHNTWLLGLAWAGGIGLTVYFLASTDIWLWAWLNRWIASVASGTHLSLLRPVKTPDSQYLSSPWERPIDPQFAQDLSLFKWLRNVVVIAVLAAIAAYVLSQSFPHADVW